MVALPRSHASRALAAAAAFIFLSLTACGTTPQDPAAALRQAGVAMAALHSLSADMTFGAGARYQGFDLQSGTATTRVPDGTSIEVKARRGDAVLQFGVIDIGGHAYLRAPLLGWSEVTGPDALDLKSFNRLLDPSTGLPALLPAGRHAAAQGNESIDGHDCLRVSATYDAARVAEMLSLLTPQGDVTATSWIDTGTHVVRRMKVVGPLFTSAPSSFEVHLHDFDRPVDIRAPI